MVQLRRPTYTDFSLLVKIYTPILILWISAVVLSWRTDISLAALTRDPVSVLGGHPFVGFFSNLAILLWCASTSVCLFSFAILNQHKKTRLFSSFLLSFGCFTFVLLLDDLFLIHEVLAPAFYISEKTVLICYFVLVFILLIKFKKVIAQTQWLILVVAFFLFGASIVIDFLPIPGRINIIFEDMFKLLGIASWFAYFNQVCFQVLNNDAKSERFAEKGQAEIQPVVTWLNCEDDPDQSRKF